MRLNLFDSNGANISERGAISNINPGVFVIAKVVTDTSATAEGTCGGFRGVRFISWMFWQKVEF